VSFFVKQLAFKKSGILLARVSGDFVIHGPFPCLGLKGFRLANLIRISVPILSFF
jgi:hypothetical protein